MSSYEKALDFTITNILAVATVFFMSGIIWVKSLGIFTFLPYLIVSLLGIALFFAVQKNEKLLLLSLLLLVFLFGGYSYNKNIQKTVNDHHIVNALIPDQECVTICEVKSISSFTDELTKLNVNVIAYRYQDTKFRPTTGIIKYTLKGTFDKTIYPGATVAIKSKIKRPWRYKNKSSFDYPEFLAKKDIYVTGFIKSPIYLKKVNTTQSLLSKLKYLPEKVRFIVSIHR